MREVDSTIIIESVKARDDTGTLNVSLHQRFGSFLLDVNFHVPLGLIVLFGASGAGKSLTLRSVAGLLHPKRGYVAVNRHILFNNAAGVDLPPQERHIGYVPQHYALFPHLTVAENILFALPRQSLWTQWGKGRALWQARVRELLDALELDGLERRYPATLSGGQQQRVALARALAAEPYLLLLDEPFNALDTAVRERLRDTLKQFQRRFAVPIVLVTHDHAEAQQLADTIVVLQQGRVVQVGSVEEIFYMPCTPYVARLGGQHNAFGGYIATPPGDQPSAPPNALRLSWLQANGIQEQVLLLRSDKLDRCWLPLPLAPQFLTAQTNITGCIRTDEVLVHSWPNTGQPPVWTTRGAVQWRGILLDAQIYGHAMRLLVQPRWTGQPETGIPSEGDALELYLSRGQWREIEVDPGQPLLLEIGPEAIHWFEIQNN